ncbi:hypothetical protein KC614_05025, partial [candidate division WWE3 bacterium]|nr:hypothetical protein [candidate division WWE3 bacterium]
VSTLPRYVQGPQPAAEAMAGRMADATIAITKIKKSTRFLIAILLVDRENRNFVTAIIPQQRSKRYGVRIAF